MEGQDDAGVTYHLNIPERRPPVGVLRTANSAPPDPKSPRNVTWDEEAIAEHDLERGTRMKIDEPDTPWERSPQAVSDDEEAPGPSSSMMPTEAPEAAAAAPSPADLGALASRLEDLVSSGAFQRGNSAGSEEGRSSRPSISFPEDAAEQRSSSDNFKDHRAKHYNEGSALKAALKKVPFDGESSCDSNTSDEEAAAKKKKKKALAAQQAGSRPSLAQLEPGAGESAAATPDSEEWKAKRNAHYNSMAQALKSKPPISDDEDDD